MATEGNRDLRQERHRALADSSRRRLLRVLEDAPSPLPVNDLADLLDLHANTVRGHLEVLERAGLVVRQEEERTRPGRPRALYSVAPGSSAAPESDGYRFLAEILATLVATSVSDPATAAEEVGRAWGRYLVERPAPFSEPAASQVVDIIVSQLADIGFEPETEPRNDRAVIKLHDCPFREVARSRQDVVCSVHLGLMRGMAEEQGGQVSVSGLRPFVEPSLCIADVEFSPG